jgi:hypothetical protein
MDQTLGEIPIVPHVLLLSMVISVDDDVLHDDLCDGGHGVDHDDDGDVCVSQGLHSTVFFHLHCQQTLSQIS